MKEPVHLRVHVSEPFDFERGRTTHATCWERRTIIITAKPMNG